VKGIPPMRDFAFGSKSEMGCKAKGKSEKAKIKQKQKQKQNQKLSIITEKKNKK